MNHLALRAFAVCALLLCIAPLFAITPASTGLAKDPVTGLNATQAVKLGADKFIEMYEQKTQDQSNVGMCNAANTFTNIRRYINDRAAVKRPKAQQTLIKQIRTCCTDIMTAYVEIDEASSGGGTIHRTEYASGMIDVETTIGKVILAMEKPAPTQQGRRHAAMTISNLLANMERLPKAFTGDPAAESWKQEHNEAVKRLRSALSRLQQLLKSLPDNGGVALARFASDARKNVSD